MSIQSLLVNNRQLSCFDSIHNELNYHASCNYLFDLSHLGCLEITGEHASAFLQGQISCDVNEVNDNRMRLGALCNVQGRIIALPHVIKWNGLKMILPLDQLESIASKLIKPAMLSRVKLSPNPSEYKVFGFYLQNENDVIPLDVRLPTNVFEVVSGDNFCCYMLAPQYYVFFIKSDYAALLWERVDVAQRRGGLAWHERLLSIKHINIYPNSSELFLPHNLELHTLGFISFNKGCYKGQEIIARTHYRAKLKYNLKIINFHTTSTLYAGQQIFASENKTPIGHLVDFCPLGGSQYIIAISSILEHEYDLSFDE